MSTRPAADPRALRPAAALDVDDEDGDEESADAEPGVAVLPLWQPTLRERVREAWSSRYLLPALSRSSIPRYRGRILGRAWLVLPHAMHVFGFALIFGGVFGARAPNGIPYILFLLLSLLAFRVFQLTVIYETVSTQLVKRMTRSLRVPLLLVPISAMSRILLVIGIYSTFTAIILAYYVATKGRFYLEIGPQLLAGLAGLALCVLFGFAIGLMTSVIFPRARDVRILARYVLQIWIFVTPVFYPLTSLPSFWQTVAQFNPLTPVVGLVQYGFLGAGEVNLYALAGSVGFLSVLTAFGLWFFNRFATRWIGIYTVVDEEEDDEELI